ncbi:MAG: glutathione S-transferase [Candidatus Poseidoniales archaeon]|nr:MAG: glutathione S-transferase [Candidatus Poseidoniales archaeon]
MTDKPILYSFRRCPYAMRARMSIVRNQFQVEHREVILRDRPEHMMEISPKGTVPVLLLPDGRVIEESLEIMQYVLDWQLSDIENQWVTRNDDEFKFHLDRYKYPNRYDDVDGLHHRKQASIYLSDLDNFLDDGDINSSLSDALFPFVRQFANHDRDWFDSQTWNNIHEWLSSNLESSEFKTCMKKYKQWHQGDEPVFFPIIE